MKRYCIILAGVTLICSAYASEKKASLGDLAQHAVEQSKLTLPASAAFHLKATLVETTNPKSQYKGEIEEYWVSPDKWRRMVTSPEFSQILVVNGVKTFEQNKGDYFPWWLNDLVTAVFDPLPMLDQMKQVNMQVQTPSGNSTICPRFQVKVGTPPAENDAFYVFCFAGNGGLLESVSTPGYEANFNDYKRFKNKEVSRRITIDPEPGTTIEVKVTELNELNSPDESFFSVEHSTPVTERIKSTVVPEATIRKLSLSTPEIIWSPVRSGKTSGVLSMYVSIDRTGHVRETWPLNSDNAGLEDSAREQVKAWQFKTGLVDGIPVQVQTVLTFSFNTKIGDPIPILSDEDARKLATYTVEPIFPPGVAPSGTLVRVQVGVQLDGTLNGVSNISGVSDALFLPAAAAVRQWRFRPYLRNGKPDLFGADIVFRVP